MRLAPASGFGRILEGLLVVAAASPPLAAQGYVLWQGSGSAADQNLGGAVAGLGDVNGDGHDDVAVGAPYANAGATLYAGYVRVYSGGDGSVLLTIQGSAPYGRLGFSLAGVGDVSGDGVPDLAAGAPYVNVGALASVGQVRLVSGADASTLATLAGSAASENFGTALAFAGDVNGDGTAELVVGAPGAMVGTFFAAGQAKVFSLPSGAVVYTLDGAAYSDQFGRAVANAGDVDGDGYTDMLVGAPGTFQSKFSPAGPGYAKVFSGYTGAFLLIVNGSTAENLGTSVAGLGDVDGDGHAEFAVQAPNASFGGFPNAGVVRVYSGAGGAVLFTTGGSSSYEGFGRGLANAGDLDGDGVDDLLVGAPNASAGPSLFYAGSARVVSGATGETLFTFAGTAPNAYLGSATAAAGDVNADGYPDVVLGAPGMPFGALNGAGQVKALSVVGLPPTATPSGSGCAGSGGLVPTIQTCGGPPTPGNLAFGLSISRAVGGTYALLFFSTSIDPAGYSLSGCTGYLAGAIHAVMPPIALAGPSGVAGEGYGLRGVSVPADPALSGGTAHFQWQLLDLGSPNGLFTTSNALSVTVP